MNNPSLQEQLQALVSAAGPATTNNKKHPSEKPVAKPKLTKKPISHQPAWLEYMYYGIELLKAHYPLCFKEPGEIKPLKIGIKQDLVKQLSGRDDIVIGDKSCMIKSLGYYVTTLNYFKNVIAGVARIDLEGNEAGLVSEEEARYSAEQHRAKLQKKSLRTPKAAVS